MLLPWNAITLLQQIIQEIERMSGQVNSLDQDIQQLQQDVSSLTNIVQSAVALITGLAKQLQDAIQAAGNAGAKPEQLQALTDLHTAITAQAQSLADAVAANTSGGGNNSGPTGATGGTGAPGGDTGATGDTGAAGTP
jgi:TolA-binding protein